MNRRGNTLIGMMAVLVIIAILGSVFMYGSGAFSKDHPSPRKDGKGTTIPGLAEAKARDTVCQHNLTQVRESIQIAETGGDDQHPGSLQDLHLPSEILKCPIGHEAYVYDPTTGQVHCPHPGHETL